MSNLRDFLDFKLNCLHCNDLLSFRFITSSQKTVHFTIDEMTVNLQMNGFPAPSKKKVPFSIQLYINLETNQFKIEFFENDKVLDYISISKMQDIQTYIENIGPRLYQECASCRKYNYSSSKLIFDYKNGLIEPFQVHTETYFVTKFSNDTIKRYKLINNYVTSTSTLFYDKKEIDPVLNAVDSYFGDPKDYSLETPIIKMDSSDDLGKRLDTLITFS